LKTERARAKKFTTEIYRLGNVMRFSGDKLDSPYTVGEHCYRVVAMAIMTADFYNYENPKKKVDIGWLSRKAVGHDLEESIMGDIPSYVKKHIPGLRGVLREGGEIIIKKIFGEKGIPKVIGDLWEKAWVEDKSGDVEGEIIEVLDKLEGFLTCAYEFERGNYHLHTALAGHISAMESDKMKELLNKFTYPRNEYEAKKHSVSKLILQKYNYSLEEFVEENLRHDIV